jgi:hypothetical protein
MSTQANPFAPPASEVADVAPPMADATALPFFAVSTVKLAVMSTFTLGFYQLYWSYRQWSAVRRRTQEGLYPVARAVFAVFFCYGLFRRVRQFRSDLPSSGLAAGPLAIAWIVLTLLYNLPFPLGLLGYASFLPLLPVQSAINAINRDVAPAHDPNARFSGWNWTAMIVGVLFYVLLLIGLVSGKGK